ELSMAPEKYVSPDELRSLFNEGRYYERMQEGELMPEVIDVGPSPSRFPRDIRSQTVAYLDQARRTIVIVHQYGYDNGDVAEGTLPDPRFLFEDGIRYKLLRGCVTRRVVYGIKSSATTCSDRPGSLKASDVALLGSPGRNSIVPLPSMTSAPGAITYSVPSLSAREKRACSSS
ncbi:MAG: hypothetical protein ACRDKS_15025, partial [Actinomycetota bacterium]